MKAVSVLEHFSDHDSIHQKLKKNTASVYSIAQLGRSTVKSLNDVRSQVKSAYQSNSAITDIDVTFDGTWLIRGHSSQIGVGCVIDLLTGFVMVFLKLCRNAALNVNTQNLAALAHGEVPGPHVKHVKTPLKETYLAKIMPIYQRLASNELLQRYIRCVTQNANESLHSIIWGKCSKETSATLRRVTIAVCDAVCEFNFEMPKRKRGLTTDEIQKILADLEVEIFDGSDSDCELENEEDDL
ncbi:uncharacterized protein TNCV_424141 [Trichonephila clavipes]|nr:uncharacterized protein TNCV_424141 [Trichonephila clavipes]